MLDLSVAKFEEVGGEELELPSELGIQTVKPSSCQKGKRQRQWLKRKKAKLVFQEF